jgi:repressor LexA
VAESSGVDKFCIEPIRIGTLTEQKTVSEAQLSEADRKALAFVRSYAAEHGRPPSYVEIGTHLGLTHPNNAKRNCDRLRSAGLLAANEVGTRAPGRPRALKLVEPARDLVFPYRGRVSCGSGAAPEDRDEEFDLRAFLKAGDAAVFRARGDSMIEAQIADGDLLIVTEDPDPPIGSVVIALVGEQMLCKRLARRTRKTVLLEPCNGELPPVTVDTRRVSFQILGVLRNVIRKV